MKPIIDIDFIVPAMAVPILVSVKEPGKKAKKVPKKDINGNILYTYKVLPKERPRFGTSKTGKHVTYSSSNTTNFEKWIRTHFFKKYPGQGGVWYNGTGWPVHDSFIGCCISEHLSKTLCNKFRQGKDFLDCQVCSRRRKNLFLKVEVHLKDERHIDLDNIQKIVLDALNKVCYYDDTQFCKKVVELIPYSKEEHLRISIGSFKPYFRECSLVGCYSIKNMKGDEAEQYVTMLLKTFKADSVANEWDFEKFKESFFDYLERCDGRNYTKKLNTLLI